MQPGMGAVEFFLLEGSDYLEQLDALAQSPAGTPPASDDFLRLTRAFRGSALMAQQQPLSRAAQGLESCARALRENRLLWDERVRGEVIRAVDDCKVLLRRLRTPEQGDTEKAEQIGATLDKLSGRASAMMRAAAGSGLDAGGRAFVAREAAAIASTLQRAATTLAGDPGNRDVLNPIIPSMSALRGVAAIQDLPPLADLLAAVEAAVKETSAMPGAAGRDVAEVFDAGGRALARAAREVVDLGRPDPESDEAKQFAARLLAVFAGGHVVPIESLFFADAGPHIVREGTPPTTASAGYDRVEMVSQGEFLTAATAELRRAAASPVQSDLRLFTVAARLRPLVGAGGSPLQSALGRVAESTRDAIGRGAAAGALDEFIALIGHAAEALAEANRGTDAMLAERLESVAAGLEALPAPRLSAPKIAPPGRATRPIAGRSVMEAAAAAPPPAPAPMPMPMPAAPPAAAMPQPPMAAAAPVPAPAAGGDGLAGGYMAFEQLIAERGLPLTSIDELLAGGSSLPMAAPGAAPRTTGPRERVVPIEELAPVGEQVVPVESLVYRGERALRRALELKSQLDALAQSAPAGDPRLAALMHEVFDLVELGLAAGR